MNLVDQATRKEFWLSLCPSLSVTDQPLATKLPAYESPPTQASQAVEQVIEEGYFSLPPLIPREETHRLAQAINAVVHAGYPAPFALVYDDVWTMLGRLEQVLTPLFGTACCLTRDIWIYYVRAHNEHHSPSKEASGWAPHRDGTTVVDTLHPDGRPQLLNVWVPLTDATAQHSFMHVLPTNRDPSYPTRLGDFSVPTTSLQHIRALPAPAGSVLGWNEYALHWGSTGTRWAAGPRISIAVRFQSRELAPYDFAYMDASSTFTFEDRLGLIGFMMQRYQKRAEPPASLREFCDKQARMYEGVETLRRINQLGVAALPLP